MRIFKFVSPYSPFTKPIIYGIVHPQMGRKTESPYSNILLDIIALLLIAPLIVLKWIGDVILVIGKIIIFLMLKTHNFFLRIYFILKSFLNRIYLSFLNLYKTITLFYKKLLSFLKLSDNLRIILPDFLKRLPRPSFPTVKLAGIPASLQLFILKIKYFLLGVILTGIIALIYQLNTFVASLPNPAYLSLRDIAATTKIYDRNGNLLYEVYAEENRTPIRLANIPEIVKQATIAIEDKEFLNHRGFSIRGIVRAIVHNLQSSSLEGGSTITQQLIRSALLTPEKTLLRKVREIILSVRTEQIYSKDQILEMYLNQVPYGGTAWGIEAAAQTYFGKSTSNLSLAEAAVLAGLPAAPSRFSPFGTHPELAKIRQQEVLGRMLEDGYISQKQMEEAKNQPLSFKRPSVPINAPHFVMYTKDLLEQLYGSRVVEKGGLKVITSLDLTMQEMAQKIISDQVENLRPLQVGNGAALITNPKTGEILAMVGSTDYFDKQKQGNVNVTLSQRQPGSSIKAVTYTTALISGLTAATILDDSPITYYVAGQPPYSPVNYDGRFHGRIPLRVAFASSYNVPAVKTLAKIGIETMIDQGKLMGITSWEDKNRFGLSLTLGGGEVTMLDMAEVYGVLAAGGVRHNLNPFTNITNIRGETLSLPVFKSKTQAVPPGIAFIISSILSDNIARTPAFGANSALAIPGKTVAVKTGTSDNKRDNWTIGYTPDYVVVVWVGNNDNTPMHPYLTSGVTGAAPIWHEIMENLLKNKEDKPFLPPVDVVSMPCYGRTEYFIQGTEPKGGCPRLPTSTPPPTS